MRCCTSGTCGLSCGLSGIGPLLIDPLWWWGPGSWQQPPDDQKLQADTDQRGRADFDQGASITQLVDRFHRSRVRGEIGIDWILFPGVLCHGVPTRVRPYEDEIQRPR